jgi:hypothetical protein
MTQYKTHNIKAFVDLDKVQFDSHDLEFIFNNNLNVPMGTPIGIVEDVGDILLETRFSLGEFTSSSSCFYNPKKIRIARNMSIFDFVEQNRHLDSLPIYFASTKDLLIRTSYHPKVDEALAELCNLMTEYKVHRQCSGDLTVCNLSDVSNEMLRSWIISFITVNKYLNQVELFGSYEFYRREYEEDEWVLITRHKYKNRYC